MTSWRDDQRFQCPDCGRLIYLTMTDPDERWDEPCTLLAICIDCRHTFTAVDWRARHIPHDPPNNVDIRPGTT